jgi:peptidoglycan/xylan/chitin deacetylase (PgdA/CDA1 family)
MAVLSAAGLAAVVLAALMMFGRFPHIHGRPVKVIDHGARTVKAVALTFDACSAPRNGKSGIDAGVVRYLEKERLPATLFLGGRWMERHQGETRRLARIKNLELGLHGYGHPDMKRLSDARVARELDLSQKVFTRLTGRSARLFRPPYGVHDDRIVRISSSRGLVTVGFDLASGDPDPAFTRGRLVRSVVTGARGGSIVIMHVNGRGWHTAESLPEIVRKLRAKGYSLVTVGEMVRYIQGGG